jgi:hypothetical protein
MINYPGPPRNGRGVPEHSRRAGRSRWHLLLLVPVLLALWTPLYNRLEPRVAGMPFFYWGQLALVPVSMLVSAIVYALTRHASKR